MSHAHDVPNRTTRVQALLCFLVAALLATGVLPVANVAFAADATKAESVLLRISTYGTDGIDVVKNVATLDKNKPDAELTFTVVDAYSGLAAEEVLREFALEDSSGNQTKIASGRGNQVTFATNKLVDGQKLMLVTSTQRGGQYGVLSKKYSQQLNVRLADTQQAERSWIVFKDVTQGSGTGVDGVSKDGTTWSFSNGLQVDLKNTGLSFFDNTSINLGLMRLPLKYKHEPDGTTIVGINCTPEDKAFYNAVKNGNVWQKYSTEAGVAATKIADLGWSGKKFGTWGGKAFDWSVCGYMEFNTKKPEAPRAVNLIISMGLKADGHAQYLCFTGTLTFTAGGKAMLSGKLTPPKGLEGKFGMGVYAGLELYIGLGLQYVASVGGYGKAQISADFQILPEVYVDKVVLSGELGAKAKLFGFTLFTWTILKGEKPIYQHEDKSKTKAQSEDGVLTAMDEDEGAGEGELVGPTNADGTAISPYAVSADAVYPLDSREYLYKEAPEEDALSAQASMSSATILKGIYGEADPSCVTTNSGPVVAYIADADQVEGGGSRDDANRSALVYTRYKDGAWTKPVIVDAASSNKDFADFKPAISTDGENCYITWLSADSKIESADTLGNVGKKLDVYVATITPDDQITVELVSEESDEDGTMPSSPKAVRAGDGLYVGWFTNQTSGSEGQILGLAGAHTIRLYKRDDAGAWTEVRKTEAGTGALTSFDVGIYGGEATCAWSLDDQFRFITEPTDPNATKGEPLNNDANGNKISTLQTSTVYALRASDESAARVSNAATNAQFAKDDGADVLTYAIQAGNNTEGYHLFIRSSTGPEAEGKDVLDGANVELPTVYYTIAGDLGRDKMGNISFLALRNGSTDIRTIVTTGHGKDDWTSILEATVDDGMVTSYCATYANGLPLFIYTTKPTPPAEKPVAAQAEDEGLVVQAEDDGGADLMQTTEDTLKHLSVEDADFDEYEVKAGQTMPITVHYTNDGMLDVDAADLWVIDRTKGTLGAATWAASNESPLAIDADGTMTFNYTLPEKDAFTAARELVLYVAPKGATVTTETIEEALEDGSALAIEFGEESLALEVEHQIVDGQESIVATITNDGIVPHGAKLLFVDSDTGATLVTVDVPELGEAEQFTYTYAAPNGYFQKDGIKSVIITLEDDGTDHEGYEINNTEFVSTWDIPSTEQDESDDTTPVPTPNPTPTPAVTPTTTTTTATRSALPDTGDPATFVALLSFAGTASLLVATRRYK